MKKDSWFAALQNLTWLTQLGLSLAVPPILCLLAANWLSKRFGLGEWVFGVAIIWGVGGAVSTFVAFARMFARKNGKK